MKDSRCRVRRGADLCDRLRQGASARPGLHHAVMVRPRWAADVLAIAIWGGLTLTCTGVRPQATCIGGARVSGAGVRGDAGEGGRDAMAVRPDCRASGSGALGAVKLEEVARIANGLARLTPHYDRVILDLAAGIDPTVLRFARAADRLILVTTEEPTALTDAYAMVKLLRLQGSQVTPWVIVNMSENRVKGRKVFDPVNGV